MTLRALELGGLAAGTLEVHLQLPRRPQPGTPHPWISWSLKSVPRYSQVGTCMRSPPKYGLPAHFGPDGPACDWQATGSVLLAMGGYTALTGDPGRAPLTLPGHSAEYPNGK